MERSALFISALNEIKGLTKLFPQLPLAQFDECYALDGGSTDGTVEFFEKQGIPVMGKVKKGEIFNAAAKLTSCENLVFYAPDGNEDPKDIPSLLGKLKEGDDMVIASRFLKGARNEEDGQLFKWRKWANQTFTFLVRLIWGGKLSDTINGFRACKRSKILEMNLEATGFDIEFQMSIRALKLGYKLSEIPTLEGDRIGGKSTAFAISTGSLVLKRLIREIFLGNFFIQEKAACAALS
ncbi:MAG: glycosyltransferase family 2 protein [Candidatus Omnitrophica bacterium]|nr:glycosyltransferase family 2 protein [Candidatus Omnitrophota bacterium]